jgi:hypothetical protein
VVEYGAVIRRRAAAPAIGALFALSVGCSSAASILAPTTSGTSGNSSGSTSSGTASGGGTTGGSSGGTTGGTTGGESGTTGSSGTDAGFLTNAVNGPLGFDVVFAGLLYNAIPDAGPDLSNVDVRLTDGPEAFALCPFPDDGGVSWNAVDIYLINGTPESSLGGTYSLVPTDAGPYAVIYRSRRDLDSGLLVTYTAREGSVQCVGSAAGVAGTFSASFHEDAGNFAMSGSFNVPYCGSLTGS